MLVVKMSVGECINLIRVNREVNGLLDIENFISQGENQAMVVSESGMDSYAIPATDQPSVLTFEFFHSKNPHKRDPLLLPECGDVSSDLRIVSVCYLQLDISSQLTFLFHRPGVRIPYKVYGTIKRFGYYL
jgi:hypothetical protein